MCIEAIDSIPKWMVGLFAVAVGFILNEASTVIRTTLKAKKYKEALNDELESNLFQLEQKEDIANQIIEALKQGRFLSGLSVPFSSTVYIHHFPSIIETLNPIQRDNVRHIYSQLKVLDEIMSSFETDYKDDVKSKVMENVNSSYIGRVDDVSQSYKTIKDLITKYLSGNEVDIYYRKK